MKLRQIFITSFDKKRLDGLIEGARDFGWQKRDDLQELVAELKRAKIVDPKDVPADVVTMNSKVLLHYVNSAEEENYKLVFPNEADFNQGLISVLAPIGTAILGYREGDTVEWNAPSGKRQIRIDKIVYQPESAGHYDE